MRIASMSQLSSSEINIALLSLGGLVLVLGLLSGFFKKRLFLSDPIVALLLGVLLGPAVPFAQLYRKRLHSSGVKP